MMKKDFANYFAFYIIMMLILATPVCINYLFLRNSGELLSDEQIFAKQNLENDPHIYGSAIFDDINKLKLYAYEQKKAEIVSVGSSRVLEFRESFFAKPFYNMGYTITSIYEALITTHSLLKVHKPDMVILGVDFWWFNEAHQRPVYDIHILKPQNHIDPGHLLLPFRWLKENKIQLADYANFMDLSKKPHVGVKGKLKKTGLFKDGSYYYTDLVTGDLSQFGDVEFLDTKLRIAKGERKFEYGVSASQIHFDKFLELLALFKKHNVNVVLLFPPLAPTVNVEMQKYEYGYIRDLKQKFENHKIKIYDFTDPLKWVPTSDCEFIDGYHSGDVLNAKILNYLVSQEPDLEAYVNREYLKELIEKYSGLAMIPNVQITSKAEVDFLNLGCRKTIDLSNKL